MAAVVVPAPTVRWVKALISFGSLVGFVWIFGYGILRVWAAAPGKTPVESAVVVYVGTGLATLVGGIFAVGLGTAPPPPAENQGENRIQLAAGRAGRIDLGVGGSLLGVDLRPFLATLYIVVYLVIGFAATATWVAHSSEISDLVKNLAATFLGLAVPIAGTSLRQ